MDGDANVVVSAFLTGCLSEGRRHFDSDTAMINDFFDSKPFGDQVHDWEGLRSRVLTLLHNDDDSKVLRSLRSSVDQLERKYMRLNHNEKRLFHLSQAFHHLENAATITCNDP